MQFLLCDPQFFTVCYEINPWMDKKIAVDGKLAGKQWQALKETLLQCGAKLHIMEPADEWPDMVFTANAGLIYGKKVVLSRFHHPERQGERAYFEAWFKQAGFEVVAEEFLQHSNNLTKSPFFEGAGDALFAGDTLFAGFGFRTDIEYYHGLSALGIHKIVFCELVDSRFYHIDTCFCPLNAKQAIWWPGAFSQTSQKKMHEAIELFAVPEEEAARFACNAVVVGKQVILPWGCPQTQEQLEKWGYTVHSCDMSEFLKAGGACKCLTLALD